MGWDKIWVMDLKCYSKSCGRLWETVAVSAWRDKEKLHTHTLTHICTHTIHTLSHMHTHTHTHTHTHIHTLTHSHTHTHTQEKFGSQTERANISQLRTNEMWTHVSSSQIGTTTFLAINPCRVFPVPSRLQGQPTSHLTRTALRRTG